MYNQGEMLTFTPAECIPLTGILNKYIAANRDRLDDDLLEGLNDMHELTAGMLGVQTLVELLSDADDQDIKSRLDTMSNAGIISIDTDTALKAIETQSVKVGEKNVLEGVFRWAADNLYAGSTAIQNTVGPIIDSGFEAHPVSSALGSTNERLTEAVAEDALSEGDHARAWLALLES